MDYREHYPTLLRLLSGFVDIALFACGALIVSIVFINATLRGTAGFDLAWSLEVTAFMLLWVTFLGCAAATARGAHMRVTEIVSIYVPEKMHRPLSVIIDLIIGVLLVTLITQGYNISSHTWAQRTTVLYWPVGLLYASMPVGMLLTLVFHSFNFYLDLNSKKLRAKDIVPPPGTNGPENAA